MSEVLSKICVIEGDCGELNLGISTKNCNLLHENVTMIFHLAASVKFNEKYKKAINVNVRGTREVLNLASKCENLKIFFHFSSILAHLNEKKMEEKVYECFINPHIAIAIIENFSENQLEILFKNLKNEKNFCSYAFTKSLAESLVAEKEGKFPIVICRTSIISPIFENPIEGWTKGLQGIGGLMKAGVFGVIRTLPFSENDELPFIPVDFAVNDMMAYTWKFLEDQK